MRHTQQFDLFSSRPVSIWNKELKLDIKSFFSDTTKTLLSVAFADSTSLGKNTSNLIKHFEFKDSPEQASWKLIFTSISNTFQILSKEYSEFCKLDEHANKLTNFESLINELESRFVDKTFGLNSNFLEMPQNINLIQNLNPIIYYWLYELQFPRATIDAFWARFKTQFVLCIHREWLDHNNDYQCIEKALKSPFVKNVSEIRNWQYYRAWLCNQINERMFGEAFGISRVYIPLRAYCYKPEDKELATNSQSSTIEYSKHVVDLNKELNAWVKCFNKDLPVRLISGGPGVGKSSFVKMFAAQLAEQQPELPVLVVPLQHLNLTDNLNHAVAKFINDNRYLTVNPLDLKHGSDRLLLIFDGLDELTINDQNAQKTAFQFVEEVVRSLNHQNSLGCQRQALITGRQIPVQFANKLLAISKNTLHILPYQISIKEKKSYKNTHEPLFDDQRKLWWKMFWAAKGSKRTDIPAVINTSGLDSLTTEPLLNYLLALSYLAGSLDDQRNCTLNNIYNDLIKQVYRRQYDITGIHRGIKHISESQFEKILQEIALTIWHGQGRTATISDIQLRLTNDKQLSEQFEQFTIDSTNGVTRLLTAFYFQYSDKGEINYNTVEFTHKSFGEFLTAKRIVQEATLLTTNFTLQDRTPSDSGIQIALKSWMEITSKVTIDNFIYRFILDELSGQSIKNLNMIQNAFAEFIRHSIKYQLPQDSLDGNYNQQSKSIRNSNEALLIIHSGCARLTKSISVIKDDNMDTNEFVVWFDTVNGATNQNRLARKCWNNMHLELNHVAGLNAISVNFDSCIISGKISHSMFSDASLIEAQLNGLDLSYSNLTGANLRESNLDSAILVNVNLSRANLESSTLTKVILKSSNLTKANLSYANMNKINLVKSDLTKAKMINVNLEKSDLNHSCLYGANLKKANISFSNISKTNLKESILIKANLINTNFQESDLSNAVLTDADLRDSNLRSSNLSFAILKRCNMSGADLENANLSQTNLAQSNLSKANLTLANLKHSNLTQATLKNTILTRANLEKSTLIGANITSSKLSLATMVDADLSESKLCGSTLAGVNLRNANLTRISMIEVDLRNADLTNAILTSADLKSVNLQKANLTKAKISRVTFTEVNLAEATLTKANLTYASLINANLTNSNLACSNLKSANLTGANISYANLSYSDMQNTCFSSAVLQGANMTYSNLRNANLAFTNLIRADLTETNSKNVNFLQTDLTGADLTGADLSDADFINAKLIGATLISAVLKRTNLTAADMTGADLTNANLEKAILNQTNFEAVNLKRSTLDLEGLLHVKNLDKAKNLYNDKSIIVTK